MSDSQLVDANGRPYSSMRKATSASSMPQGPLDRLSAMGISQNQNGSFNVPPEALRRIRNQRIRRATVSRVPSTPKFVYRDGGGVGVRKGMGRFEVLSLESIRKIREASPILQTIHSARHYQLRRMAKRWNGKRGTVGWRVVHRNHHDPNYVPPDSIKPYIKRFERMLEVPSAGYCPTTSSLIVGLWEDLATINRPVLELLRSAWDENRIVGFRPVDGAIIWPTLLWLEKWLADHPTWWRGHGTINDEDEGLEIISGIIGHDITTAEYCLVREGVLEAVYDRKDMLVGPLLNRTDVSFVGYPPSHVEQAIESVLTFLNTWDYNASYFTRGMMSEFIIGVSGDIHDDDIDAFVDMFREASQGVRRAWQPPIMPLPVDGSLQKIDLKPSNREMMFETWLSLLVAFMCAGYRMDPSTVNAKPWDGGSGSSLSEPNREKEITLAKEEGLQGDLGHLAEAILTPAARTCHPDLEVIWEFGDIDPMKEAELYEVSARCYKTRNEIRLEAGDKPKGFWLDDEAYEAASDEDKKKFDSDPWNQPTDAGFASAMQMAAMGEQQPGMDGMPGEPPGDGFGEPQGNDQGNGVGQSEPQFPYGQPPEQPGQPLAKAGRAVTVHVHDLEG